MKKQGESIELFDLPFVSGVEMISGRHITNSFRRHFHKTYIIGIVNEGNRSITHSEGSTQIFENEIFIINPGQVHACRSENPSGHSYKVLSIPSDTMQSIAAQILKASRIAPYFNKIKYKNKILENNLIQLFNTIKNPQRHFQAESYFHSFFFHLIKNYLDFPNSIKKQRPSIRKVCDYIEDNFTQNLHLKKLAQLACLSPFHFQREFKRNIGTTPHEYLNDFRIRESMKMLSNSKDIADIAIQLGYFDQSHFSKIFKKTVGVSPGKYQKRNHHC